MLEELPSGANALRDRAEDLIASGDLAGGLLCFQQAVLLAPKSAMLQEAIAQLHGELDDHAAALQAAAQAVDLAPEVRHAAMCA